MRQAAGGAGGGRRECTTKNKNPTQRCGGKNMAMENPPFSSMIFPQNLDFLGISQLATFDTKGYIWFPSLRQPPSPRSPLGIRSCKRAMVSLLLRGRIRRRRHFGREINGSLWVGQNPWEISQDLLAT